MIAWARDLDDWSLERLHRRTRSCQVSSEPRKTAVLVEGTATPPTLATFARSFKLTVPTG